MDAQGSGFSSWFGKQKTKYFKHKQQPVARGVNAPATVNPPIATDGETAASHATPSKKAYAFEATKQTLDILSGIVGLVGIPLVKEVTEIGVSIISTCENINEVQGKVEELKNRVAGFLIIIVKDPENDPTSKTSQDLMEDLQEFKKSLILIKEDLQAIANQNVMLTTFLPKANMDTIDACANRFQDVINRFQTLRGIHAAQDLNQIQNQLQVLYSQTAVISQKVDDLRQHLCTETTAISQKVDDLRALLERTQQETDPAITSIEMPPLPDVFVGRKAVVDRIAEQLASCRVEKSRICVLGPGGIGKSSVASAVMEHATIKDRFPSKNRFWVPCVSLRSPGALLAHLARRLGTSGEADPLEAIISTLNNDGPYLIHLDNFETPWHPIEGGQASTKRIIQSLDGVANVSILVTMRSECPPLRRWKAEHLEVLSLDDCRQIYTTIATKSEMSQELDELLESVGRLPYAVMLLAKQAEFSRSSPSELLGRWKSEGPRLLSDVEGTTSGMEASIELSIRSSYVTNCQGALQLLQTLSLLPAGVYRDDLSIWMKSWEITSLGVLRNACLVISRDVETGAGERLHLYVLPVVQSYFRQGRIPVSTRTATHNACFEFLRTHRCVLDGPNAPGYGFSRRMIAEQETNIQALLTDDLEALDPSNTEQRRPQSPLFPSFLLPPTLHIEALLTFVSYQVYTKLQPDFAERVHSIVCSHSKESLNVAFSTYYLAQTKYRLRSISDAMDLYQQAKDLFLRYNRPIEACDADFNSLLCRRNVDLPNPSSNFSLPQAVEDAQTRWKDFTSDPTVCSLASYWTGYLHFLRPPHGMKYSGILSGLLQAKTALISQHRLADAFECLKIIVRILLRKKMVEEARTFAEEAMKLMEDYGLQNTGFINLRLAKCLKISNSWGPELMTAIVESLTFARKAGLPYSAAGALEELGEVYVREENWEAARLTYEEALKECRKGHGFSIKRVVKRARDNLTYIGAKEIDPGDDTVPFIPPPRN